MKRIIQTVAALAIVAAGLAAASLAGGNSLTDTISTLTSTGGGHTPVTICHKPEGANPITIIVDDDAVPAHLAHGDHLGACVPEDTTSTPTDTTPTTTTPTVPPPKHDCTFTGAGKDGQSGNDDCATKPNKPVVTIQTGTSQVVCPPDKVVTQTITITKTVQSKPKVVTRVINHVKTKIVYRTKYVTKIKKIYVPGMHKNGSEGSG